MVEKRLLYPTPYRETVKKYALEYGVEESLIYAVIKTESSFNERALSEKGAKGLMQITDKTANFIAKQLNVINYDIYSAETNIKFGAKYLSYLYGKFVDTKTILYAYNAGEGNVAKWLKDEKYSIDGKTIITCPYGETVEYANKTLKARKKYLKYYKNILDKKP